MRAQNTMLACVDVDYRDREAIAACVVFRSWNEAAPAGERIARIAPIAAYQPGRFNLRELPCLLAVLGQVCEHLEAVIVDGYVWLDEKGTPGLGGHLHAALGKQVAVIGVAKTRFAGATAALAVLRGKSRQPLYVTAAGLDVEEAARHVLEMHGPHRLPTLLKRVDRLCRDAV